MTPFPSGFIENKMKKTYNKYVKEVIACQKTKS